MDPVVQDIKRHGIEESKYQKAFEALREIVKEDYCLFESFLMDEYPDIYNEVDDLERLHWTSLMCIKLPLPMPDSCNEELIDKWLEYVDRETERRIL